jgi:type IV pilus assembly protein PilA
LIELLVVITIVSILTAIAIPEYRRYRANAYDLSASFNLRSIATAEEAYFLENESYLSCSNQECLSLPGIVAISKGVEISIEATHSGFTGSSTHKLGSGKIFNWDSSQGGIVDN